MSPTPPSAQPTGFSRFLAWLARPGRETDVVLLLVIGMVTILVFSNGLTGDFVYDDSKQILQSPLVRDPAYFWAALTRDVWSFKQGGNEVSSDYWRPLFMLWLIGNYRLWGVESTVGWHLGNLGLHLAVVGLAYLVCRQLGLSRAVAAAITLLFAIHPVHVESVTWISGSPDLLMALFILGAYACALAALGKTERWNWYVAALILFILALLAKESAILFPLLLFITIVGLGDGELRPRLVSAGIVAGPFAAAASLYFGLRLTILGQFAAAKGWSVSTLSLILTQPNLLFFYMRQSLIPFSLGPSYPVRAVTPDNLALGNFILPAAALLLLASLFFYLFSQRQENQPPYNRAIVLGLTLFLLFLAPVLQFRHFIPEHIVHDRYLYLPLLGFLLILIPGLVMLLALWQEQAHSRHEGWVLLLAGLLCLPLSYQTIRYNSAWQNDLALWERGVRSDPTSQFNLRQYAYFLRADGQFERAISVAQTVVNRQAPTFSFYDYFHVTEARLLQIDIWLEQGALDYVDQGVAVVLATIPEPENGYEAAAVQTIIQRAYERLSLRYQQSQDMVQAIAVLRLGREAVPERQCDLTTNLAVLLYLSGDAAAARQELETVRGRVALEYSPLCAMVYYYLGQLYGEAGEFAAARQALQQYLTASATFYDSRSQNLRRHSQQLLATLP